MKFKKIVSVGIPKEVLQDQYWQLIDKYAEQRLILSLNDPNIDQELKDADCLLVWFNGATKELIDKAPNLKYIGALATGVGKIDVAYAQSRGITVTNIPGYSTEAVSELIFGVLLEKLRDLSRAKIASKSSRTSEADFSGTEIKGKDFGVIGLGSIGSRVGEIAAAFGANIYYWSRSEKAEYKAKYTFQPLEELVQHCDFVSINLSLNSETEGILDASIINSIKENAVVINTAPLELLDLDALDQRLEQSKLTFIFDHTDPGDISDDDLMRLRHHNSCITYPVLGYITDEAKIALQEIFVTNIARFLEGNPQNKVT